MALKGSGGTFGASAFCSFFLLLSLVLLCHGRLVNGRIDWVRPAALTDSFLAANDKPILMVIRKSWCIPCMALKDELDDAEKSASVAGLSGSFIMVDAADVDEPVHASFAPDGKYIPRVIFLDSAGKVRPDIKCGIDMKPRYQYYYSSAGQVAESMERVANDASFLASREDIHGQQAAGVEDHR